MDMPVRNECSQLMRDYQRIRRFTGDLTAPLCPEDTVVQSMADVSPIKWHLAHTTWFFEEFVLRKQPGYRSVDERWRVLFNSYFQSLGPMHGRFERGLLSRPTLREVQQYRDVVDAAILELLARDPVPQLSAHIALGLQHEQQHQELILTDIKHVLSCNPLRPVYRDDLRVVISALVEQSFLDGADGLLEIGAHAARDFAYDCETPRHRVYVHPHRLAQRPVSNAEYREFMADGGYRNARLWLSEAWHMVNAQGWTGPLYWDADAQSEFTLGGQRDIDAHAPVCHVSYYEADAFARWAGARLPTEAEWEVAASAADPGGGHYADAGALHPQGAVSASEWQQLFGDVWEWTASPYVNYPGFQPMAGALGEYNGKFMCGQWVLRGGSCATPAGHVRASYRNFFYPKDRWQFSGIRLAKDVK